MTHSDSCCPAILYWNFCWALLALGGHPWVHNCPRLGVCFHFLLSIIPSDIDIGALTAAGQKCDNPNWQTASQACANAIGATMDPCPAECKDFFNVSIIISTSKWSPACLKLAFPFAGILLHVQGPIQLAWPFHPLGRLVSLFFLAWYRSFLSYFIEVH